MYNFIKKLKIIYKIKTYAFNNPQKKNSDLVLKGPHIVEIDLSESYPREKPYFTYKTEIFHPNFGNYICIADHWAPSSKLSDLIYQIGASVFSGLLTACLGSHASPSPPQAFCHAPDLGKRSSK